MTIFTFPSIVPTSSSLEIVSNTKTFRSPLTNSVQTSARGGSLWSIKMQFNNLTGADKATLQAFLAKLNGQEHRFYLQDHGYVRRGAAGGSLLIKGAAQVGSILLCDNATANVSNYSMAGDYVSFNNELHMVTANANSDASGNITLAIAPPIRKPTIDNDWVINTAPVFGVFMLASKASWSNQQGLLSSFSVEAVEDVLA